MNYLAFPVLENTKQGLNCYCSMVNTMNIIIRLMLIKFLLCRAVENKDK